MLNVLSLFSDIGAFEKALDEDEDFNKARNAGISNSQLYKQAGNSIVVNVLQAIFRQFNFEKVSAVDCKYENERS